jgi:hypothetical protein
MNWVVDCPQLMIDASCRTSNREREVTNLPPSKNEPGDFHRSSLKHISTLSGVSKRIEKVWFDFYPSVSLCVLQSRLCQ